MVTPLARLFLGLCSSVSLKLAEYVSSVQFYLELHCHLLPFGGFTSGL